MHLAHCLFKGQWIIAHGAIHNVMYALTRKNGHTAWTEQRHTFTSGVSLRANLYMTRKDQVFVTNVVVIDPMWEMWLRVSLIDQ
jgi:hypothetical protein